MLLIAAAATQGCGDAATQPRFTTLVDPTGCALEQITDEPFDEYQVQGVSHDGTMLAYAWDQGEDANGQPQRGAHLLDLTNGERTPLPISMSNAGAFDTDGGRLIGAQPDAAGRTEIVELDLETGETHTLASHEQWDWLPSYSPDGRMVVFNSYRDAGQADIFVYERTSGTLRQLTTFDGYDAHAQFSPDGARILFHRMIRERDDGGYDFDILVLARESGAETVLISGPFEESYGAFAPDGQHVVFSSDFEEAPEKHNLYVFTPASGSYIQLTDGDWKDSYAYWTPGGDYIYFNSDREGVSNIYRMPMRGFECVRD